MAGTEEEFLDLVSGDAYVDIDRLRKLAVFGVPADEVRGVVWRHLLLVSKPTDGALAFALRGTLQRCVEML